MSSFRFVCAQPKVQPSSGYAQRIPQDVWSYHEEFIRRLHACGTTRDDILRALAIDHDFRPSNGQLRDQMARWGLRSSKKHTARTGSARDEVSSSATSGSSSQREVQFSLQPSRAAYIYTTVTDDCFDSLWPQFDMGNLQYETAIEKELLADILFLGQRFVAAHNLYSSIYYAASVSRKPDLIAARFRALLGCLKSSASSEQRLRIVFNAEQEQQRCCRDICYTPDELDLQLDRQRSCYAQMTRCNDRETFRYMMTAIDDSCTVGELVKRLHIVEDTRVAVLKWCFARLNSFDFISTYNEQGSMSGASVARWASGGSQSIIYWYLLTNTINSLEQNFPQFVIRHSLGHEYTCTVPETFAIVAAMVSSEPWLFSLDKLPPEGLHAWTETITLGGSLFETISQNAIKSAMVPNFVARMDKTNTDTLAAANGYPAYQMPSIEVLKSLAARMREMRTFENRVDHELDAMELVTIDASEISTLTFETLIWQYSNILRSYVNENCAYGTCYQFREKPPKSLSTRAAPSQPNSKPARSNPAKSYLVGSNDPMLTESIAGSSFKSFQSTHLRSKRMTSNRLELEPMDVDAHRSSNLSRQYTLQGGKS